MYQITLADEDAMLAFGNQLAQHLDTGCVIFLYGDLGAGKTTLARGVLRGLGHAGPVKSPTFTLVEPYNIQQRPVHHFDLYRLADPEELEYMGIRDYFAETAIVLIEWPDKGSGLLPAADLSVCIHYEKTSRRVEITAHSGRGRQILNALIKEK